MLYEIRVEGELGREWAEWIDGLCSARAGQGVTLFTCSIADQAALFGILKRVRDLGMPLLSVRRLPDDPGRQG